MRAQSGTNGLMEQRSNVGSQETRPASFQQVARQWTNSQRFRPVLLLCAGLIAIFGLERGLLAVVSQRMLVDVSNREMLVLFANGFREDLRVLAWLILPLAPLLSLTPNHTFTRGWLRSVLEGQQRLSLDRLAAHLSL